MTHAPGQLLVQSADVDEMVSMTSQLLSEHRLVLKTRRSFGGRLRQTRLAGISLNHLIYGVELEVLSESLGRDVFLMEVPLSGMSITRLGERHVESNSKIGCILSSSLPFSSRWSGDCSKILIKIERASLERHLCSLMGQALKAPLRFEMEVPFEAEGARTLRSLIDVMMAEADATAAGRERTSLRRSLASAFFSSLLLSQPHNHSHLLRKQPNSPAVPWYIRRTEEYLKGNLAASLSLSTIASHVGVSERTLQIGFQRFRGVSPMTFLREQRLHRARELLNATNGEKTVRELAHAAGFTNMSKFARLYRARFGHSPRQSIGKNIFEVDEY